MTLLAFEGTNCWKVKMMYRIFDTTTPVELSNDESQLLQEKLLVLTNKIMVITIDNHACSYVTRREMLKSFNYPQQVRLTSTVNG